MGCCCFSSPRQDAERRPLLHQPESARTNPTGTGRGQKTGSFTVRHVNIPDLDLRFKDVAETFNKQQKHYDDMKTTLQTISARYQLSTDASLSQCLRKMTEEHDQPHIGLKVAGYDFTLEVNSETDIPDKLKKTKEDVTELSKAAKHVLSGGPKLQEMIDSLLRAEETIIKQVEDASSHQERIRLVDNLKENFKEVKRAKELSPKCRNEARDLLKEVAQLVGITG